jgi:hypothetical protein
MNRCALVACVFVASLVAPSSGAAADAVEPANARVQILFGEFTLPPHEEVTATPPPSAAPAPVPFAPVVDPSVVNYVLRTAPPDVLIRYYFRDTSETVINHMLRIAKRESGLGKGGTPVPYDPACAADNPRSSAAGLFQTLSGWSGLASTLEPPVTWAEVAGPDCLGDVRLARAIYARSGLGPWQ